MKKKWIQREIAFLCTAVMLLCSGPAASVDAFAAGTSEQTPVEITEQEDGEQDSKEADGKENPAAQAGTAGTEESAGKIGEASEPEAASEPKTVISDEAASLPSEEPEAEEPEAEDEPEESQTSASSSTDAAGQEEDVPAQAKPGISLFSTRPARVNSAVQSIKTEADLTNLFRNGGSGRLDANITMTTSKTVSSATTLDLNGNTITYSGNTNCYLVLKSNLTLTGKGVIDSYIQLSGSYTLKADADIVFNRSVNTSNGTIDGGVYRNYVSAYSTKGTILNGIFYGVVNSQNIEGGTFYGTVGSSCTISDSAKVTVNFMDGTETVSTQQILKGQKATPPTTNPSKASDQQYDYTFDGWYTASTGGTKVTDFSKITEDKTYYARYTSTLRQYTVTWSANGGNEYTPTGGVSGKVDYGTTITAPSNTPEREDYTFAGWYDTETGGNKVTSFGTVTGDITFYAHWNDTRIYTEEQLKTLLTNGGSGKLGSDITLTSNLTTGMGKAISLNLNGHTISGQQITLDYNSTLTVTNNSANGSIASAIANQGTIYSGVFTGRVVNRDGIGLIYGGTFSGEFVNYNRIDGGTFNGLVNNYSRIYGGTFNGTVNNFAGTTQKGIYGGTFNGDVYSLVVFRNNSTSNGGTAGYTPEEGSFIQNINALYVKAGSTVTLTATPNEGYHFVKWQENWSGLSITGNKFIMPKTSVEIQATFAQNPVITFDAAGGTMEGESGSGVSTTSIRTNADCKLDTLPTATRSGYTLEGWKDGNGDLVTVDKVYTDNTTLTATWTPNRDTKYVVNYYVKDLGKDTYSLDSTEEKTGTTASSLTVKDLAKDITGFTYEEGFAGTAASGSTKPDDAVTTTDILADGTRVINLYYARNIHTVTLKAGRGIASVTGDGNYEYGAQVTYDATLKTGYDWTKAEGTGWTGTNTSTEQQYSYTMPDKDVTDTANAEPHAYSITYDLDGGSLKDGDSNPESYTIETDTFTLNNPEREGYEFLGWTEGSSTTPEKEVQITTGTTGSKSYKANWKDVTAPAGTIKVGGNDWDALTADVSFDLYFKEASAEITASDNGGDSVTVGYLISDQELSAEELAQKTFSKYTDPLTLSEDGKYILYAKLTDASGNVTYLSTDGFVIDSTAPAVENMEDGAEYVGFQTFAVQEGNIESMTLDGKAVDVSDGKITVNPSEEKQTIVITDKAGNVTRYTVTIHPVRMIEGMGQSVAVGSKEALKFRSNADFGEDGSNFDHVEVDGKTLDPANYKAWSGSTYAQLTGEYVSTLSVGEHTIAIASKNGTADTTFTVTAAKQSDDQNDSKKSSSGTQNSSKTNASHSSSAAKTGDTSHVEMYCILLAGACTVLTLLAIAEKQRRRQRPPHSRSSRS